MDDRSPDTQPSGALVPPPTYPPTAVATSAPLPPRPRRTLPTRRSRTLADAVRGLANEVLNHLDDAGDRIARTLGMRPR